VIADIESDDDSFLKNAARRGIFAYVKHGEQPGMEHTPGIVLSRYAEFNRLDGALRTGAIIEQAKGILMERHGITGTPSILDPPFFFGISTALTGGGI
jgi:AmiR/NasT family two-component response regulator